MSQIVTTDDAPTPEEQRPSPGAWARWRPVLMRLHFYGGILAGPFIFIAALTGLLYTLTPSLDGYVYRDQVTVDQYAPQQTSLQQQIDAARTVYPDPAVAITSIKPPTVASETTQIAFAAPGVPDGYSRTVFVNPYTAHVQGTLTTYGQWLPIRAWFDELHRNLHLGEFGRNYSELAASWLSIVALGGLALWIAQARRRKRGAKGLLLPLRSTAKKGSRKRSLNWHGAVGVWIVLGLLGLSVTGLTWSKFAGENVSKVRAELTWTTPSVTTALPGGGADSAAPSDPAAKADQVLASAERAGLQAPLWMKPPSAAGQAWEVYERKRTAPTRMDSVAIDPQSAQVIDHVRFSDWSLPAKLTGWAIDAHMGVLFGTVNQIALLLLAAGLITVIARGYIMWWRRRPTRGGWPLAPRRGALGGLRPGEAVAVVAVILAIGWFMPLFGASIAAFVIGDVAVGEYRRNAKRKGSVAQR